MAIYVPVISLHGYGAADGLEFFTSNDIYRWDVDNRPLENLADNDVAIFDALEQVVLEIQAAYDGTFWPTGSANVFGSLEGRLDNMDEFLRELFEIRNVQFSSFLQTAAFLRERYTSGFLNGPYPDRFIRSNFSMENNETMPSPFGGFYVPETSSSVKDQDAPDEEVKNMIAIETRIEQDASGWVAKKKPVYIHVNGFIVPLFNAHGGVRDTGQTITDNRAFGLFGPVSIGFPPAPNTGHRFDFAFLEVWLQEISQTGGTFYPYGSRDYSMWSGRQQLGVGDGNETVFSGQLPHRDIVTEDEAWGMRVFLRDDLTAINWDTETAICEDNGSTGLADTGYLHTLIPGATCNGNIAYDTGIWDLTFAGVGAEPAAGKVIVAVYRYNGIPDADDETVRGTISFLPNGNYLQVQHRIRVVPGVNYETYTMWFDDPVVEAQGPNAAAVSNYTFDNGLNEFHDGSLWYSGTGDSASKVNLGSFDGYIYGVPLCAWSRYNKAAWSYSNQNGGTSRPDGTVYNIVDEKQFIDLRPVVFSERYDIRAAAENTLDRILRGEHRSIFAEAQTNFEDTGDPADWVGQNIWATDVPELWRVVARGGTATSSAFNYVRDIGLSTNNNYSLPNYAAPLAHHDGIRRIFSPQEEVQDVAIRIEDVDNSNTTVPNNLLISYDKLTKVITLSTSNVLLSGYSADPDNGLIINDTYPRLYWRGSRQPVKLSVLWGGLGTKTATATIDSAWPTYEAGGTIDGYVDILYPECTGIDRPLAQADYVEFDDGVDNYNTYEKGNPDGSPDTPDIVAWKLNLTNPLEPGFNLPTGICADPTNTYIYVCDAANSRVVKLLASDLTHVAQFPTLANYPVTFPANPNTQLTHPVAVACNAAGDVFVVDREDHRLVKLNSALTAISATFGDVTTPANDPTSTTTLKNPEGVVVDATGYIYVSDTGMYRVVKLNAALTYQDHIGDGISGAGQGQFIEPAGLTAGSVGGDTFVYVADKNRLVQVDAANMTVANILGSKDTPQVQNFFRHVTAEFFGAHEDVNGNRYFVSEERSQIMRFDASWNLTHTWGEDGVPGWDNDHCTHPRDLIYDPYAQLLYVGDWRDPNQPDGSRILVFDATNLELRSIKTLNTHRGIIGLAFYGDAGGTGAKLYCCAGDEVYRFSLGAIGTRNDASTWTQDWVIDQTTYGGSDKWIMLFDMDVSVNNDFIVVMDVWTGRLSKVDITGGTPGAISHCQVAAYTTWPPDQNGGVYGNGVASITITPDNLGVYCCGQGSLAHDGSPAIRVVDITSMSVVDEYTDAVNWSDQNYPLLCRYTKDGNLYVGMLKDVYIYQLHSATGDYGGFIPDPGPYPAALSDIGGDYIGRLSETPISYRLNLDLPWENIKDVTLINDLLYVCDVESNTLTVVEAQSLLTLGQIGNPATVGRGKAAFTGPSALCVIGNNLFFTDTNSNRVMKGYKSYPSIEKNVGRVQYLVAPAYTAQVTFQIRYTPYQGVWDRLSTIGAVYGRHFVTDNNTMYISTLGRGTLTRLQDDSGAGFYANMIARIPTVVDTPLKNPRVGDEYLFAPEGLPITAGMTSPFLQLPVLNRYPSTAQEMYPVYGSGSRFDFNRFFFLQGPGKGWSDSANSVPEDFMRRGFYANGMFPGFDTLVTFPLQTLSIPRMIFSTMVVELDGEGYLLIFVGYACGKENTLNDGTAISADIFKLHGNPGIKTRY